MYLLKILIPFSINIILFHNRIDSDIAFLIDSLTGHYNTIYHLRVNF